MGCFGSLSGQVARNSEPFMRQVFVTGDTDDEQLARQVRTRRSEPERERGYGEYELATLHVANSFSCYSVSAVLGRKELL